MSVLVKTSIRVCDVRGSILIELVTEHPSLDFPSGAALADELHANLLETLRARDPRGEEDE